jgi:hypothetical protein
VYIATPTPKWHQQRQTRIMFGGVCLVVTSLSIGLGVGLSRPGAPGSSPTDNSTVPVDSIYVCNGTECLLKDWKPCNSSDECLTNCCSGEYSGGILACTPLDESLLLGGYQPTICVGEPKDGYWPTCSWKTGCGVDIGGCCSGHFTGGNLTCTPITPGDPAPLAHICITPSTNCTDEYYCIGEWVGCMSSSDCDSGCCSGILSGGVPKCVPVDEIFKTSGPDGEVCAFGADTPPKPAPVAPFVECNGTSCLGDWIECSSSSECDNSCCSDIYSNGVFKCTPLDPVGYNPDICMDT